MLPLQTVYQTLAGIETPIPVLVIKGGVFVVLIAFAVYFDIKLFASIKEKIGDFENRQQYKVITNEYNIYKYARRCLPQNRRLNQTKLTHTMYIFRCTRM